MGNEKSEKTESSEQMIFAPQRLLEIALTNNAGIEQLEKLMDLQERWEAKQAKIAFTEALSKFQKECPIIRKRKDGSKTRSGAVAFKYSPIDHILIEKNKNGETVQELITKNGFSYIVKTPLFTTESVTAAVEIRHIAGHSETSSVTLPLVTKTEIMSAPQVVAGTITLAKRYAFCNGFGIISGEPDLDGMKVPNGEKQQPENKADAGASGIPGPTEKVNWEEQIKKAATIKELKALWARMSESERAKNKETFTKIKLNIESAAKKEKGGK